MKSTIFAGCALAFSLLGPVSAAAPATYDAGALRVEQVSDTGPALVFIPGLASGSWVWRDTAERLRGRYAVYLLTLPGFDGRERRADATLESLQRDLAALLESRKIGKPVLVGHSLGGTLSLAFAAAYPDRIAGVVAVDGLPVFPGTESVTDRKPLAERARAQFGGQTAEQFAAGQQAYMKQIGSISESTALELAKHTVRSDPQAVVDFMAQVLELDLRPKLAAITVPVVEISPFHAPDFAAMGIDEERKAGYYRMLLGGIGKLEVLSISPARHFAMFDQPEKFAQTLDRALATVLQTPSR